MKTTVAVITLAFAALTFAPSEASAWYCRARSPSAWGWGSSASLAQAKHRALMECAVRTPRRQTCYVRSCR